MTVKSTFIIMAFATAILGSLQTTNAQNTSPFWSLAGNNNATASSKLGTTNAIPVRLMTNNRTRIFIDASGKVGIGTTAPAFSLDVQSNILTYGANVKGINQSGVLRLQNTNVSGWNAADFFDNVGTLKAGVGFGNATVAGPFGSKAYLTSIGTDPLVLGTNNSIRLFVDGNNGNVGIGTTAPAVKLHVVDGSDAAPSGGGFIVTGFTTGANIAIDDNEIMARDNGAASALFLNHNGGNLIFNGTNAVGSNVGIGTTSPVSDLHVVHDFGSFDNGLRLQNESSPNNFWNLYTRGAGDLELSVNGSVMRGLFNFTTGAYTSFSDRRMKKDIEKSPDILSKVLQLEVIKYHGLQNKPADQKYYGLIAQDVEKFFPEIVYHTTNDGSSGDVYTMDYSAFGVLAIKALQEQQQKITLLEERIAKLEAAINSSANSKSLSGVSLEQNQPNPFNRSTIIRYKIPEGANAQIMIYDASGRLVKTLQATQSRQSQINAGELNAGTYTYSLMLNGQKAASKTMVLMK